MSPTNSKIEIESQKMGSVFYLLGNFDMIVTPTSMREVTRTDTDPASGIYLHFHLPFRCLDDKFRRC
jgi:hypothetical protein